MGVKAITSLVFATCWIILVAQVGSIEETPNIKDPILRSELLLRVKRDQEVRKRSVEWMIDSGANGVVDEKKLNAKQKAAVQELADAIHKVDLENTTWLKYIVSQRGFPAAKLVGKDGAHAAWLLVQHSDHDPAFQRKCLDLMSELPAAEISQFDVAYLTDRVLIAEGKKQRYGTQLRTVNGKLQPSDCEDEVNLNKRRAAIGLKPLAEYVSEAEKAYFGSSR